MIDLPTLRDASGPLWPDIAQAIQEAQTAVLVERDAAVAKCEAILAVVADPSATKEDVDAVAKRSERERRVIELTKARDEAQARLDEVSRVEVGAVDAVRVR